MVNSIAMFYVLFERTLVPMVIIIAIWGQQPERIPAIQYISAYTVGASFPLLLVIVHIEVDFGSRFFWFLNMKSLGTR